MKRIVGHKTYCKTLNNKINHRIPELYGRFGKTQSLLSPISQMTSLGQLYDSLLDESEGEEFNKVFEDKCETEDKFCLLLTKIILSMETEPKPKRNRYRILL